MNNSSLAANDLSFLVGKTLEQVCIGSFQTLLNFANNSTIEVACGLEIVVDGQIAKVGESYTSRIGIELVAFLGKMVSRAEKSERMVCVIFEDQTCARLLLKNDGYESINVSGGPHGNLTFY